MIYKKLKNISIILLTFVIAATFYLINIKPIIAINSYSDLFINQKDMNISFGEEIPNKFKDYDGVEIERDFDLGMSGVKLNSKVSGSSIDLSQRFIGDFEMSFRAYSETSFNEKYDGSYNSSTVSIPKSADLKEVSFIFTSKSGESFTVHITAGEKYNTPTPAARVEFSGGTIGYHYANDAKTPSDTGLKNSGGYYTRLGGTTFVNVARTGGTLSSSDSKPVRFGFNSKTMEVYAIDYGTINKTNGTYRVIVDLDSDDNGPRKIDNFDDYTVSIKMTSITNERTANMIIYDINGQSMAGETLVNSTGPKTYVNEAIYGLVNKNYSIETPRSFDLIDGLIDFKGTVKVLDSNNNEMTIYNNMGETLSNNDFVSGGYFVPTSVGKYKIIYQARDLSGLLGEERVESVTVISEFLESTYSIKGSYKGLITDGKLAKNSELTIFNATVLSQMHNNKVLTSSVSILKNGLVYKSIDKLKIEDNMKIKFDEVGKYQIVYTTPEFEIYNSYTINFEVLDNYPMFRGVDLDNMYSYQSVLSIPEVKATLNGETKNTTITLYDPDGNRLVHSKDVTLNKIGEYKIEYLVRFNSNYTYTKYFQVGYGNSGIFTTDSQGLNITEKSDTGSMYPSKIKGVEISSEMEKGYATYNRTINLSTSSKYDSLIELAVIPSEISKLDFWQFVIRLTDVHNSKNYVDIIVFKGSWGNEWSYVKAGANNQTKSGWENGKVLNAYNSGTPVGFSFTGESMFGHELLKLYFDYEEKAIYVDNVKRTGYSYGNQVIDLDSTDCFSENTLWNGFTTGEVTMSIHFEYVQNDKSKLLIKSINGVDLGEEFIDDNEGPTINVNLEEYTDLTLPSGLSNVKYPIFDATSFDKINGFVNYNVKVFKNYQKANQQEISTDGNYFTPTTSGTYTIVYSSYDLASNNGTKTVNVVVKENLPQLNYLYDKSIISSAYVGEEFTLPRGEAVGGSGNKKVTTIIKDPNGNAINLENNRFRFTLNGTYTLTTVVKDFLDREVEVINFIGVEISDNPIIYDFTIPLYFINGFEYKLEDFEAYDYSSLGSVKDVNKIIKVIYNGNTVNLGSDRKFTPDVVNHGDEILIKYIAENKETKKITEKVFTPKVLIVKENGNELNLSRYFFQERISGVTLTDNYIEFAAEGSDSKISLANSIIASNISFDVVIPATANNMSSFTISLVDAKDPSIAIDLKIFKNSTASSTTTLMSINGGVKHNVAGSFYEKTSFGFSFYFNKNSNSIVDLNTSSIVDKVLYTKFGKEFNGFTSNQVYISFTFNEVVGNSAIRVKTIVNQPFSNVTEDRIRPLISTSRDLSLVAEINETFIVPHAYASDVLSNNVDLYLTIRQGSKTIYEGKIDEDYEFVPTSYGLYRIIYTAIDGSNRRQETNYMLTVKDRISPTITLSGEVTKEASVGTKLVLPTAIVEDNNDLNLRLYIFITAPDGQLITLADGVYEFTPTLVGEHSVIYYAQDTYNSYSYVEHKIRIKKVII